MSRRYIIFGLCLAVILGFCWYKARENERVRQRQAAWQTQFKRLHAESQQEYRKRVAWLQSLLTVGDARTRIFADLQPAPEFVRMEADRKVVQWRHPVLGVLLEMDFSGAKLVGYGVKSGTGNLLALNPQPSQFADTGWAESVRRFIAMWAWQCWIVALVIAILFRKRSSMACLGMLGFSLAAGAAWLLAPIYDLTMRGIFSNDNLFFACVMYALSVVAVALHRARGPANAGSPPQLRFGLRTLMVFVTLSAILLAMGGLGFIVIAVSLSGVAIYLATLTVHSIVSGDSRPTPYAALAGTPHD